MMVSCYIVILPSCHPVILSIYKIFNLSSCHLVSLADIQFVILSICQPVGLSACKLVSFSACVTSVKSFPHVMMEMTFCCICTPV